MERHGRARLPNQQLGQIIEIKNNIQLPTNIVWAGGEARRELMHSALAILQNQPKINAVVLGAPAKENISCVVDAFYRTSSQTRILPVFKGDVDYSESLRGYFNRRAGRGHMDHKNLSLKGMTPEDFETIQNFCLSALNDATIDSSIANHVGSALTFTPQYNGSWGENDVINSHIDAHPEFDVRIVEAAYGSPTLVFEDNDFLLRERVSGTKVIHEAVPLSPIVNAWSIPRGAALAVRTPSPRTQEMGSKPCVHAHGMGKAVGRERRLTFRHDYCLI